MKIHYRDCYCYQGVDRCDFCTGRRPPDRLRWEFPDHQSAVDLLTACKWQPEAPSRFVKPGEWARIDGLGSTAGMPTIYAVKFGHLE
jgi:hypothetical protein